MKPLSGLDALFLHLETPATPMHVGAVHLLQPPKGHRGDFVDDVKRHVARRLSLSPVFTRQLAEMPLNFANPVWVRADEVGEAGVFAAASGRGGDLARLRREVEQGLRERHAGRAVERGVVDLGVEREVARLQPLDDVEGP